MVLGFFPRYLALGDAYLKFCPVLNNLKNCVKFQRQRFTEVFVSVHFSICINYCLSYIEHRKRGAELKDKENNKSLL